MQEGPRIYYLSGERDLEKAAHHVISKALSRFKSSPDREYEMSLNRLILQFQSSLYTFWCNLRAPGGADQRCHFGFISP